MAIRFESPEAMAANLGRARAKAAANRQNGAISEAIASADASGGQGRPPRLPTAAETLGEPEGAGGLGKALDDIRAMLREMIDLQGRMLALLLEQRVNSPSTLTTIDKRPGADAVVNIVNNDGVDAVTKVRRQYQRDYQRKRRAQRKGAKP